MGHLGIILGSSGDHLGVILGSSLGHLGFILGSSWGYLGIILGSSWGHLGALLRCSGALWGDLGGSPVRSAVILGPFILGVSGDALGLSGATLVGHQSAYGSSLGHLGKCFKTIIFLCKKSREGPFRVNEMSIGVPEYRACAQKLAGAILTVPFAHSWSL